MTRTTQSLTESHDASEDCAALIKMLGSITAAIATAGTTFDTGCGNQSTINGIKHELQTC